MKSFVKHKDCLSFHVVENILLVLNINTYIKGKIMNFGVAKQLEATLLKKQQNKKDRIFVCHACQNMSFYSGQLRKRRHFGKHDKQIFGSSYFVRALVEVVRRKRRHY